MPFATLNYKQKGLVAETSYLFVISILSPFAVGLATWSQHTLANSFGYVVINILQLPVIILLYRWYLPVTIGKKRYWMFIILLPIYFVLYGLNERFGILAVMYMPFIPEVYRNNISGARPLDFTQGYFNTDIGITILVILAATSLYIIKLLFKQQYKVSTLETEKLKLELNHLKSQIRPHFFFNTLNNMYSLSVHHSPKTPLMIKDLSEIMRYVLYDTRHERVSLQQEIDFIKSYISLENLRHTKPDIIDFAVQGDIDNIKIEPLLFMPLIENTFKHALHRDIMDNWVKLILAVDENELIFQTSNAKLPANDNYDKSQGGIGLLNVRKRLDLLYAGRHELIIFEEEEIFTVSLTIQLNPLND
ncbi:sensor histidine kinase [Mucilaginibacter sp. R-33]|uniref:sensor histidine kinase n=1 Tax=Mucilaginibacter sp. R-33 TaxID=3416711 RepID=UPI003CF0BDBA